jgi:hypothetical protein
MHGLMTVARKIQNGKSSLSQGDAGTSIDPEPRIIRTAMGQLVGHAAN